MQCLGVAASSCAIHRVKVRRTRYHAEVLDFPRQGETRHSRGCSDVVIAVQTGYVFLCCLYDGQVLRRSARRKTKGYRETKYIYHINRSDFTMNKRKSK